MLSEPPTPTYSLDLEKAEAGKGFEGGGHMIPRVLLRVAPAGLLFQLRAGDSHLTLLVKKEGTTDVWSLWNTACTKGVVCVPAWRVGAGHASASHSDHPTSAEFVLVVTKSPLERAKDTPRMHFEVLGARVDADKAEDGEAGEAGEEDGTKDREGATLVSWAKFRFSPVHYTMLVSLVFNGDLLGSVGPSVGRTAAASLLPVGLGVVGTDLLDPHFLGYSETSGSLYP